MSNRIKEIEAIANIKDIEYDHTAGEFTAFSGDREGIRYLLEQLSRAREALEYILSAEPTDKNGNYCDINQPQFYKARQALKEIFDE